MKDMPIEKFDILKKKCFFVLRKIFLPSIQFAFHLPNCIAEEMYVVNVDKNEGPTEI